MLMYYFIYFIITPNYVLKHINVSLFSIVLISNVSGAENSLFIIAFTFFSPENWGY